MSDIAFHPPFEESKAVARIWRFVARLARGGFVATLPALARLASIGVGHSLGGLFTVFQQAMARCFDGLVLLGFGMGGLPSALDEDTRAYAGDPEDVGVSTTISSSCLMISDVAIKVGGAPAPASLGSTAAVSPSTITKVFAPKRPGTGPSSYTTMSRSP